MSQYNESAIFRALNEMKSIGKSAQVGKKNSVRAKKSESELKPVKPSPKMDPDELLEGPLPETRESEDEVYGAKDVSEEDLDILANDEESLDETVEYEDEHEDKQEPLENTKPLVSKQSQTFVGDGDGDGEDEDGCDCVNEEADPRDDLIKDLQERISKLEEALKEPEPLVEPVNSDSVELMENVLRRVKAPPQVRQAYRLGKYECCTEWLKKEHNILFDIYEGFTAKERANIEKALNELKAPDFVKRAFENGQHSLVSAFFKTKCVKLRKVR